MVDKKGYAGIKRTSGLKRGGGVEVDRVVSLVGVLLARGRDDNYYVDHMPWQPIGRKQELGNTVSPEETLLMDARARATHT